MLTDFYLKGIIIRRSNKGIFEIMLSNDLGQLKVIKVQGDKGKLSLFND